MYEYSFSIFVALNYNHALMTRSHYSALSLSFGKQKMQLILTSLLSHFCYLFQRQVGIFMTLKLLSQATKSKILLLNFLSLWLFSGQSTWWSSSSTVLRANHLKEGIRAGMKKRGEILRPLCIAFYNPRFSLLEIAL